MPNRITPITMKKTLSKSVSDIFGDKHIHLHILKK